MAHTDTLKDYKSKRNFEKTTEPAGKRGRKRKRDLAFLVQKHDATALHYDLRLEWDGVLKSWAVTKGPSLDPSDKRLAVMTEDHPLDYGDFEGTIPQKEYGGGSVMLWDTGTWEPLHDVEEGLKEGKLHFRIHGERMRGGWALVRMRRRKGEKRDNWLLIKERDGEALDDDGDRLTKTNTDSVKTGRTMAAIAENDDADEAAAKSNGKKAKTSRRSETRAQSGRRPEFFKPQLATLVDSAPEGEDWLHEVKFDGYRLIAATGKGGAKLFTRNGKDWTDKFGEIANALEALDCTSALIDGEVIATRVVKGQSTFSALQKAIGERGPMRLYGFDLLELDGEDLAGKPLVERKKLLARLIGEQKNAALRYSEHVRGSGPEVFRSICRAGEEGIIAKKADAPYRSGRGRAWLKVKCTKRQEFVIGGYTPSDKKGRAFASLLVGTMEGDAFIYRGRIGTGFSEETLNELATKFSSRTRKTSPFDEVPAAVARGARWIKPDLVAEIDFAEFTDDGAIRHGAFLGLRSDKSAETVTLESSQDDGEKAAGAMSSGANEGGNTVLGIKISSGDRVVYPQQGVTKIDLAHYHAVVGERMMEHLKDRPVSFLRCPEGRVKQCFFQKHAGEGFPDVIDSIPIEESSGKAADYMVIRQPEGLVGAVQMGTMEFHIWGSRADDLEKPDRLVFDLDPDEGLDFERVKEAAFAVRKRLSDLGLESLAMVTGGKGVHVVVPLQRRQGWTEAKDFAKGLASVMAADDSDRYVATMSKAKRKGRVFIDWLRNERGATAIAPYSTRAREGAPVAMPVSWDELDGLDRANGYSLKEAIQRIEGDDPWAEANDWRQSITKSMLKAVS